MNDQIFELKSENEKLEKLDKENMLLIECRESELARKEQTLQDCFQKIRELKREIQELKEVQETTIEGSTIEEGIPEIHYPLANIRPVESVKMILDTGNKHAGLLFRYQSEFNINAKSIAQHEKFCNAIRKAVLEKFSMKFSSEYRMYYPKDQYITILIATENKVNDIKAITYFAHFYSRVVCGYDGSIDIKRVFEDLKWVLDVGKKRNTLDPARELLVASKLMPKIPEFVNQQLHDWVKEKSTPRFLKEYDLI